MSGRRRCDGLCEGGGGRRVSHCGLKVGVMVVVMLCEVAVERGAGDVFVASRPALQC